MPLLARARHQAIQSAIRLRERTLRSSVGRRLVTPQISVIVPFYNVEAYFEECLRSIAAQSVTNIEVLLVDDGSLDGSRAIAESWAAADSRFRVVTRPNGGLGAARNTGVREARGTYLTFIDSDDELTPGALGALLASAEETGSEIVVGSVQRFDSSGAWAPTWVDAVHTHLRQRITVHEFLPLLRNLYTWNKLFRRDFFDAQGLWFREGVAYEDQPIITELYVAARSIDVIPDVVYRYRARDDRSSISQQTGTVKDLRDRVAAWRATQDALAGLDEGIRQAWLQTLFDAHFNWYLMSSGTENDDYWEMLQAVVTELVDSAPQELWDRAPAANRVALELTRTNRRADLQEFVRQKGLRPHASFETTLRADGLLVHLPFFGDSALDERLFLIRPEQLQVGHSIERIEAGENGVVFAGWAFVRQVDLTDNDQQVEIVLRSGSGSSQTEQVFAAENGVDVVTRCPEGDDWADYARGTFRVEIPFQAFAAAQTRAAVRVLVGGQVVEEPITRLVRRGALGDPAALWLPDGDRLHVRWRNRQPLVLARVATPLVAEDVELSGRTLSGRLRMAAGAPRNLVAAAGTFVVPVKVEQIGGSARFEVTLPVAGGGKPVTWQLRDGEVPVAAAHPIHLMAGHPVSTGDAPTLVARTDRQGHLIAQDRGPSVVIDSVAVLPAANRSVLRLTGQVYGAATKVRVSTTNPKVRSTEVAAPVSQPGNGPGNGSGNGSGGRFEVELDLAHEVFRFGSAPLPSGEHEVVVRLDDGDPVPLVLGNSLQDQFPVRAETDVHEVVLGRGPGGSLLVALPLLHRGQARRAGVGRAMRQAAVRRGKATTRGILFRSYFGEKATDNGLAIQAELQRRGSDLPVYWAVQDRSIVVPDGGIPVLVNSAEWFEKLSSVTYLVDNMYPPEYHLKPEGQVIVETFHGYPFKLMGMPHWRNQHFSQEKIDSYLRRSAEWDYLLSPATYATELLTRDFCYEGPVLEIGYPRNDVLQSAEAEEIREATRRSLGIEDGQRVLLYAPTFRDYLARNDHQAAMSDFFDFDEIGRAFGDDVVVLMRGHAFHARTKTRVGSRGTTIDVTDYPEVSDLYLAADVGVVDYSSLRFDFGVTGKPMIFLVPDLQRYVDTRGWLFDFEPTAPGPLVNTTAEVIEQLRDLDGLRRDYASAYEKFRATYLDLEDGHAAARFVDAVIAPNGDA